MMLGLLIVEVDGSGVEQGRTYKDKNDGTTKPLQGRQTGFLWQGDAYPTKISVDIPDGKGPYRPGLYLFSGEMFEGGKYGRLEFRGTRGTQLVPLEEAAKALTELAASEKKQPAVQAA
jgi:hypothetical protein